MSLDGLLFLKTNLNLKKRKLVKDCTVRGKRRGRRAGVSPKVIYIFIKSCMVGKRRSYTGQLHLKTKNLNFTLMAVIKKIMAE